LLASLLVSLATSLIDYVLASLFDSLFDSLLDSLLASPLTSLLAALLDSGLFRGEYVAQVHSYCCYTKQCARSRPQAEILGVCFEAQLESYRQLVRVIELLYISAISNYILTICKTISDCIRLYLYPALSHISHHIPPYGATISKTGHPKDTIRGRAHIYSFTCVYIYRAGERESV